MPMSLNAQKSNTFKQIGMITHICKILDNEYRLIVKELDSRVATLSEITQVEIQCKLRGLSNQCLGDTSQNMEDRQTRNQRARSLIEMIRLFSRSGQRQQKIKIGSFHQIPQHIINKGILKQSRNKQYKDDDESKYQSKIYSRPYQKSHHVQSDYMTKQSTKASNDSSTISSLHYISTTKEQNSFSNANSKIAYHCKVSLDVEESFFKVQSKKNSMQIMNDMRTRTTNQSYMRERSSILPSQSHSNSLQDSKFHIRSAQIRSSLEQMQDCQNTFSTFLENITK